MKICLHKLLREALDDLRAVEGDDRYAVCMDCWHTPLLSRCHVCLAGAWAAKTWGLEPGLHVGNGLLPNIADKMMVLNSLRSGRARWALHHVGKSVVVEDRDVPEYAEDREGFFRELERLCGELEEVGA